MKTNILSFTILILMLSANVFARSHPYFVLDIAASNDGRYVAISRMDNKLGLLYDLDKKEILKVFTSKYGMQSCVNFTPDSKYFVFQNAQSEVLLYDIEKGEIVKKYKLDSGAYSLAFFSDNNRFIWGSAKGKIEYVDMEKDERIVLKKPIPEEVDISNWDWPVLHIVISPDEKYFLSTTWTDGEYELRPEQEEDFKYVEEPRGKNPKTGGPAYISKRWRVKHLGLNLWDAVTLKKINKLAAEFVEGRTWPCFSPDGKYLLAGSENGNAIYDLNSGKFIIDENHPGNGFGFISDKDYVIMSANDEWLFIKDVLHKSVENYLKKINLKYPPCSGALATVPSKNLIITGDRDGSVSVYKYNPEKMTIKLHWHPKAISAGLIRWLSPLQTMNLTETEIEDLMRRYEQEQKKIIEQDKKDEKVLTPEEIEY